MKKFIKVFALVALVVATATSAMAQKKGVDPEAKIKKEVATMASKLDLTQPQQDQLFEIYKKTNADFQKPDADKKAILTARNKAVNKVLTPEQKAKRDQLKKEAAEKKKAAGN